MKTSTITPREIFMVSDCGRYFIKGRLVSESDSRSQDNWLTNKTYTGSHWTCGIFKSNGAPVKGIQVQDGNYQPWVSIENVCCHGMRLSKNAILYTAIATHMFSKALEGIDTDKVAKQYYKEYVAARKADGTA